MYTLALQVYSNWQRKSVVGLSFDFAYTVSDEHLLKSAISNEDIGDVVSSPGQQTGTPQPSRKCVLLDKAPC